MRPRFWGIFFTNKTVWLIIRIIYYRWGSILVKTTIGLVKGLPNEKLYANAELELQIFQTAAILEVFSHFKLKMDRIVSNDKFYFKIVHTMVGFVR
jgi:hypothetical protein